MPVSPPSPLRTVHATFTAHGSAPVGHFVSGHCSPPSLWCIPQGSHAGTWVTGRANRLWAFALCTGFPGLRLLRPHRHSLGPRRFAPGLPIALARPPSIPLGASHVHNPGLLRRPVGGGDPLSLPRSAAPQRARGYTGPPGAAFSPLLELRGYGFCFAVATVCIGCPRKQGRTGDLTRGGFLKK